MIKISQIIEHSIWEYEQGNLALAEQMLDFAIRLAEKKKKPKYKGKSDSVPTDTALYNRCKAEIKKKFDVYPSAYANAALVKLYKSRGGKYRKRK